MVTFRNNNNGRRNNFRRNDRNFKSNNDRGKFSSNFSNENFHRKIPNRNNHNASKLIEKYNNLAREALSGGDKILSENYFQHADHFTRIQSEQENIIGISVLLLEHLAKLQWKIEIIRNEMTGATYGTAANLQRAINRYAFVN